MHIKWKYFPKTDSSLEWYGTLEYVSPNGVTKYMFEIWHKWKNDPQGYIVIPTGFAGSLDECKAHVTVFILSSVQEKNNNEFVFRFESDKKLNVEL